MGFHHEISWDQAEKIGETAEMGILGIGIQGYKSGGWGRDKSLAIIFDESVGLLPQSQKNQYTHGFGVWYVIEWGHQYSDPTHVIFKIGVRVQTLKIGFVVLQ